MRTIIFRGKGQDGRWVYGDLLTNRRPIIEILAYNGTYTVAPETVGQFTGLHDCAENEIYEGDILDLGDGKSSAVAYKDELAAFDLEPEGLLIQEAIDYNGFLVIGNIHDRKEENKCP